MKSIVKKLIIPLVGLWVLLAPVSAQAAVYVGVGVGVRYWCCPHPNYWYHPGWYWGYHPAYVVPPRVVFYDGYYGLAPGGFYGYYWHGGWYHYRRWAVGGWIYF
jgi:hypothetical protein